MKFWQELKRRKVIGVIPVYAAAAFALLELFDIIADPLGLPDGTIKFVLILLLIGLGITIGKAAIFEPLGRWEEYIKLLDKAYKLSPLDPSIPTDLAMDQIEYLLAEQTWLSKTWLVWDIHFNPLNTHSGYQKLISDQKIGQ